MQKSLLSGFIVQVLVSSLPGMLTSAALPLLVPYLGITTTFLGTIFLATRLGALLGTSLAPFMQRSFPVWKILVLFELLNLFLALFAAYSIVTLHLNIFLFLLFLKPIAGGVIGNCRVSWLKQLPDPEFSRRTLVVSQTIIQAGFGIAGILVIFGMNGAHVVSLLLLDGVTSVVGAILFFGLQKQYPSGVIKGRTSVFRSVLAFDRVTYSLIIADIFLAVALSGTGVFLARVGGYLFYAESGYGYVLSIYALGFSFGGYLLQRIIKVSGSTFEIVKKTSASIVGFGLAILYMAEFFPGKLWVGLFGLAIVFTFYPMAFLSYESSWFQVVDASQVAGVFSIRLIILTLIWGAGELIFHQIPIDKDLLFRMVFAVLSSFILLKWPIESKVSS